MENKEHTASELRSMYAWAGKQIFAVKKEMREIQQKKDKDEADYNRIEYLIGENLAIGKYIQTKFQHMSPHEENTRIRSKLLGMESVIDEFNHMYKSGQFWDNTQMDIEYSSEKRRGFWARLFGRK